MTRKLSLIIGIVLFILIVGATYNQASLDLKTSENTDSITNEVEQTTGEIVYKGKFLIPVENFIRVSSGFGSRESSAVVSANHHGIDLVGKQNSKIMSIDIGEVTYAGWQSGYGNCVEIKHVDENGAVFYSFYAHMQNNSLCVKVGQNVSLGQVIGVQGSTGNSTGAHLHFEIRLADKTQINPAPYLFSEKGE